MAPGWATRLATETGIRAVMQSPRDTKLLFLQRLVRLFAYGATYLILVHFLTSLAGVTESLVGLFMTLTLLGDVVVSFVLTAVTDQVGRRRVLGAGALLMAGSGAVFALAGGFWFLLAAAVLGVISPSGNEIGPFRAVEESILAQLADKDERSDIFAWYSLCGTAGAALGTLTCGWLVQALEAREGWTTQGAYRVVFVLYAGLGLVKLCLVLALSPAVELDRREAEYQAVELDLVSDDDDDEHSDDGSDSAARPRTTPSARRPLQKPAPAKPTVLQRMRSLLPSISAASRTILYKLLLLFALDSFASGMASPSWLTYFFTSVHRLSPGILGTLFLATNLLAALSNLAALPLARRLGPLRTMVFTHLPSALFLALVPLPTPGSRGTPLAMALLAMRASTSSMDQAPRQAFLAAAVLPAERTAVLGAVNVAKTLAQAGGVGTTGQLVVRAGGRDAAAGDDGGTRLPWVAALSGAGALKASYDLMMLYFFIMLPNREGGLGLAAGA